MAGVQTSARAHLRTNKDYFKYNSSAHDEQGGNTGHENRGFDSVLYKKLQPLPKP